MSNLKDTWTMFPRAHVTIGLERLKGAFEAPETTLSIEEAARVAGLEAATCRAVLEALEDARFLVSTDDGQFRRRRSEPLHYS